MALSDELSEIGKRLAARENEEAAKLEHVRTRAAELHARVKAGLQAFELAAKEAGAPHLAVELSDPRIDDKHLHAVQFDVARGRHRVIVTVKSKGAVTLVGPFKDGKEEGPCKQHEIDDDPGIDAGLSKVLAEFLERAFTP